MSSYADQQGVWIAYSYDAGVEGSHILAVYQDPVTAARESAKQGYGHVGFMPFGWSLEAAINWWTSNEVDMAALAERYKPEGNGPISPAEWILLVEIIKEGLDQHGLRTSQSTAEVLADKVSTEFLQRSS